MYKDRVANQRAPGQKLIAVALDEELRDAAIDASGANLSDFIRRAIYEKLERIGIKLPVHVITPPRRAVKGDERLAMAETPVAPPAPPTQRVRYIGKKSVVKNLKRV